MQETMRVWINGEGDKMAIKGLNHFLFSVSNLDRSIPFYQEVFDAKLLVKGRRQLTLI
jgi:predicted enzyme related to lactoylglutathione lyase